MPKIDFIASSTRHLRDTHILFEAGRFDNSFYHAGYVVECALKAVTAWQGLSPEAFGHRLMKLNGDALDLAMAISPATARYRPDPASVLAVSSAWSTDCRYSSDEVTSQRADRLRQEAQKVWESSIGGMFLDGLIQELP